MSFQMHIGIIGADKNDVRGLVTTLGTRLPLHVLYDGSTKLSGSAVLALSEQESRDAGTLLSDGADWDAAVWLLQDDALPKLAETVVAIFDVSPRGILFRASWTGDKVTREDAMRVDELREAILSNRVPSRVTVVVRKDHSAASKPPSMRRQA